MGWGAEAPLDLASDQPPFQRAFLFPAPFTGSATNPFLDVNYRSDVFVSDESMEKVHATERLLSSRAKCWQTRGSFDNRIVFFAWF
jgi:hypothetical protein